MGIWKLMVGRKVAVALIAASSLAVGSFAFAVGTDQIDLPGLGSTQPSEQETTPASEVIESEAPEAPETPEPSETPETPDPLDAPDPLESPDAGKWSGGMPAMAASAGITPGGGNTFGQWVASQNRQNVDKELKVQPTPQGLAKGQVEAKEHPAKGPKAKN